MHQIITIRVASVQKFREKDNNVIQRRGIQQ